jgi:hypothetical protein
MLYAGLDLSRKRLDFHLLDEAGRTLEVGVAPPAARAGRPGGRDSRVACVIRLPDGSAAC